MKNEVSLRILSVNVTKSLMKNFIFCTALISYMYQLTMNKNEITPEAVARGCSLIKGPPKKNFFILSLFLIKFQVCILQL